jgi:hypothetical protein
MRYFLTSIFAIALMAGSTSGTLAQVQPTKAQVEQMAAMTPAQFAMLPPGEIYGLVHLAAEGFKAQISAAQVQALTLQQIGFLGISPSDITTLCQLKAGSTCVLTTQQISGLPAGAVTALQFPMLSPAQVAALPPASFVNVAYATLKRDSASPYLTAAQIAAITPAQAAAMPAEEFAYIAAANTPAAKALVSTRTVLLLTPATISAVPAARVATWTPETITALTASLLGMLTPTQIQALNVAALTSTQIGTVRNIGAMTASQLTSLSPAQVAHLTYDQLSYFPLPLLTALSPLQKAGLSERQKAGLAAAQSAHSSTYQEH